MAAAEATDLSTMLTSGVISAVVGAVSGGFTGWLLAGARTRREEHARGQYGARQEIEKVAGRLLNHTTDYQQGNLEQMQRGRGDNRVATDYEIASKVLITAKQLDVLRRYLVRRRTRRLVGSTVFKTADERPDRRPIDGDQDPGAEEIKKYLIQLAAEEAVEEGLLAKNLRQLHDSREVEKLRKELEKLIRCL